MKKFNLSVVLIALISIGYLNSCINEQNVNEQAKNTEESKISNEKSLRESKLRPADKISLEFYRSMKVATRNNGTPVYAYPDYFGGAYIDKEGNFVVVVVEGKENDAKKDFTQKLSGKKYIMQKGEYSYSYLDSINEKFKDFLKGKASKSFYDNYNSSYVDVYTNRYVIELKDINNKDVVNEIMDYLGNPAGVEFIKGTGVLELTVGPNPGSSVSNGTYTSSAAYRAKRTSDNKVGVVVSGHSFSIGDPLVYGGNTIGSCVGSTYGGDHDGAFCLIPLVTNEATNSIQGSAGDVLDGGYIFPGAGNEVYLSAHYLGWDYGTVINNSVNIYDPAIGASYTDLVSVSINKNLSVGDSGGLVYGEDTWLNLSAAGIIVGRNTSNYKTIYYSKASVNNYNLGVIRY